MFHFNKLMLHVRKLAIVAIIAIAKVNTDEPMQGTTSITLLVITSIREILPNEDG
jgi:hypothetical protein